MSKKISWMDCARAQSSAAAYRRALNLFLKLPLQEAARQVEERIAERDAIVAGFKKQKDDAHWAKQNKEYSEQAALADTQDEE